MHTYCMIFILTLFSTPNVPICKFQYQSMSDHCANHHPFDHYADHPHLHYANMATAVLRSLMHNSKMCWISKETLIWNAYATSPATLLLKYYILRKGKRRKRRNLELKNSDAQHYVLPLYILNWMYVCFIACCIACYYEL